MLKDNIFNNPNTTNNIKNIRKVVSTYFKLIPPKNLIYNENIDVNGVSSLFFM